MTDPAFLMQQIDNDAAWLDQIQKRIHEATEEFIASEEAWDELYDAVAEQMAEEYREQGRKSDPAEHTILAATRRAHRAEYQRLRRAKRKLEQAQSQLRAKSAAINGRQSELGALREEIKANAQPIGGPIHGQRPEPQWTPEAA